MAYASLMSDSWDGPGASEAPCSRQSRKQKAQDALSGLGLQKKQLQ